MKQLGLFTGQISEGSRFNPFGLHFQTPEELELLLDSVNVVDVGLFYAKIARKPLAKANVHRKIIIFLGRKKDKVLLRRRVIFSLLALKKSLLFRVDE
ncbi:MAG: hypothetical protein Q8R37_04305 [Nanoarchaeota archaeon]|nr:hypothetical protein [Nanoarchaeota archaeon]